jgi:hypothetical protein
MIDPAAGGPKPPARGADRTLRGATVTIAIVSLGLSGVLTYETAGASQAKAAATVPTPAATPTAQRHESDDESFTPNAAAPGAAPGGKPVAVSGGS